MSQGGKDEGGKAAGKAGGKKGWSQNGFKGNCYNCGEPGHSARWCTKGKDGGGGKMSWLGGWNDDWNAGATGEEGKDTSPIPMFAKWLQPKKRTIEISTRYQALEPEDEEEEESKTEREEQEEDRKSDRYGNEDEDDDEPGNMFKPEDPDSRADKVCPCGGIRNWYQRNCDCGMAMYWPVGGGR